MSYLMLIFGFVALVVGADVFVTGSSSIAKKFHIPEFIIGLTIVALGTSAPEIAVSTLASFSGKNSMAISNILGSNMFNLLVVLGVCAVIRPIKVEKSILTKEYPFSIFATILLLAMIVFGLFGEGGNVLSRPEGVIMMALFVGFLIFVIMSAIKSPAIAHDPSLEVKEVKLGISVLFILGGLVAIILGGNLVVVGASNIAKSFGISETVIGLTIVALGTSLPELVTSIAASRKGSNDMALGNVVGSNIFNILLTLGISSTVSPISVSSDSVYDTLILTIASILVYLFAFSKKKVSRFEGVIMLMIFAGYYVYIFKRG